MCARIAWGLSTLLTLVGVAGCGGTGERSAAPAALTPTVEAAGPPLPSPAGGGFTEITAAAGIAVRHLVPGPELTNLVDATGAGAAFADLDGDDWLDLVVLGGPRSPAAGPRTLHAGIRLYRNRRDGRFADVTRDSGVPPAATAVAVAIADVDGDGDRDLYLVDRGPNRLFRNLGGFRFEDATAAAGVGDPGFGVGAIFLDLEADGDLDLYVTNYVTYDPRETSFYEPDGFPGPMAYQPEADVLYRNRGDGTFEEISAEAGVAGLAGRGMSLAAADMDDDGDTDLFVANDATANFLLENDGSGRFREVGYAAGVAMGENGEQTSAMSADFGDVDGDGQIDLAVSDTAFGALYLRVRPGLFVDGVMGSGLPVFCGQYVSWGQNLLDFDDDGDLDLFVVNGGLHHLVGWEDLLLRNDGTGRFEDASPEAGPYFAGRHVGRCSIAGDYDNDGDLDLFITALGEPPVLLRNDRPASGWITLDLRGRRARDLFGVRVTLEAAGRRWEAESRCPATYLGQGDPRLHFGLGQGVDRVDRLRVRFPGGHERILEDLAANQILRVEEPE